MAGTQLAFSSVHFLLYLVENGSSFSFHGGKVAFLTASYLCPAPTPLHPASCPDCVDSIMACFSPFSQPVTASHQPPSTTHDQPAVVFVSWFCCQFDFEFLREGFVKQPRLTSNSEEVSCLRLLDPEMVSMSHHTQENLKDFFFYLL